MSCSNKTAGRGAGRESGGRRRQREQCTDSAVQGQLVHCRRFTVEAQLVTIVFLEFFIKGGHSNSV